jgi:hypothetical protein
VVGGGVAEVVVVGGGGLMVVGMIVGVGLCVVVRSGGTTMVTASRVVLSTAADVGVGRLREVVSELLVDPVVLVGRGAPDAAPSGVDGRVMSVDETTFTPDVVCPGGAARSVRAPAAMTAAEAKAVATAKPAAASNASGEAASREKDPSRGAGLTAGHRTTT